MRKNTKIITLLIFFIIGFAAVIIIFDKEGRILSNIMPEGTKINFLASSQKLPVIGKAPNLVGIDGWINTKPLSPEDLRGKVVLVDFWTYTCINCIRTFPHLSAWHQKYKDNGFILLGVHSPEFEFEKKKENVEAAAKEHGLEYPIALDSGHKTWRAFNNNYWPEHWLLDTEGNIRYHSIGEGRYAETESAIQKLLLEAGLLTIDNVAEVKEPPPGADFSQIGTPEIYLGYARINNIGNDVTEVRPGEQHTFLEPEKVKSNRFYFVGDWNIQMEFAEFVGENGKLIIRYKANKLNMVLESKDTTEIRLEVKLDGVSLNENNKGKDSVLKDGKSYVGVGESRFYNIVDTGDEYEWRTLEILIPSPGLRAFTFTFG